MKEKVLIQLGFKKIFPDKEDKNYYSWKRKISHPFLKGIEIHVGEIISVYCKVVVSEIPIRYSGDAQIYSCPLSEQNLRKLLKWLC